MTVNPYELRPARPEDADEVFRLAAFEDWAAASGRLSYVALATRRAAEFSLASGYEESATYFKKVT